MVSKYSGNDVVELVSNEDHNAQLQVKVIGMLLQVLNAFWLVNGTENCSALNIRCSPCL